MPPVVVGALDSELALPGELLSSRQVFPFVETRHRTPVRIHNDATLVGAGAVLWTQAESGE